MARMRADSLSDFARIGSPGGREALNLRQIKAGKFRHPENCAGFTVQSGIRPMPNKRQNVLLVDDDAGVRGALRFLKPLSDGALVESIHRAFGAHP